MTWLMLAVGFFLLLSGILSQAYSLKTKRGVLPPKTRIWRVMTRLLLFLAGLLLMAMAAVPNPTRLTPPEGIEARALAVGAEAPEVALPTAQSGTWSLHESLRSGPAVLVFYRGHW